MGKLFKRKKDSEAQEKMVEEMREFASMAKTPLPAPAPVITAPPANVVRPDIKEDSLFSTETFSKFISGETYFENLGDYLPGDARRFITRLVVDFFDGLGLMIIEARRRKTTIHPVKDMNPEYVKNMLEIAMVNADFMGGFNGTNSSQVSLKLFEVFQDTYSNYFGKLVQCFLDDVEKFSPPVATATQIPASAEDAPKEIPPVVSPPVSTPPEETPSPAEPAPAAATEVAPPTSPPSTTAPPPSPPVEEEEDVVIIPKYTKGSIVKLLPDLPSGRRFGEIGNVLVKGGTSVHYKLTIYHTALELIGSIGEATWPENDLELVQESDLPVVRAIIKKNKKAALQ